MPNPIKIKRPTGAIALVSVLFFLSGAAGLIYQTVWVRLLEMYFGVTLTAITLIVSAYMAGLGLGSLMGGRIASKSRNTVLLYGLIEAGIGVFGLGSPYLIHWVGQNTAGSPYALVFLFSFTLLLIPTLLMGMTLPLLTQAFVSRVETSGQVVGWLYGINTLGAAIGALVSGYFLMGWFGFGGALLCAAALNFLVGMGAIPLRPNAEARTKAEVSQPTAASGRPLWNYEIILAAAFLVGFIGMGFEMLWFRLLGVLTKSTAYSFPSILFVFLIALALGGWFWGRKADQSADPIRLFWKLEIAVGIVTALSFLLMWSALKVPAVKSRLYPTFEVPQKPIAVYVLRGDDELGLSKRRLALGLFEYFLPIIVMVLPAGLLMGGGLPVLDRIAIDQVNLSGRRVGDVHLANIAGSVSGTLAASFVMLPYLGSEWTLKILSALTLSFLGFFWWKQKRLEEKHVLIWPLFLAFLIVVLPGKGQFYTRLYKEVTKSPSVAVRESGDGLLALTFRGDMTDPSSLWIGGVKHSFFPSTGDYERSALTCAAAAHPQRILVIGLGGANTANLITSLPGVEEVVIVELMQDLGTFLDEYVPVAQTVFDRPAVRYISDDGRRYLYANPHEKFDMIFIDPLWSFTSGHNSLYSQEAMRLYRDHLTEKGIFCAWINERQFVPHTASTVFPYTDFFPDYLVNSSQPIEYDLEYLSSAGEAFIQSSAAFLTSSAAEELKPQNILKRLRRNWRESPAYANDPPPLTDMTPWLEYYYLCQPQFMRTLDARQLLYCIAKY